MQNVKTIDIKGKAYVTVAERVRQVHLDEQNAFQVLESVPLQVGNRWLWRSVIEVGGRQYIGHAEVHFDAPKNLPEGKSPLETAETSAIGRALGFGGYGLAESIASYDEVIHAERSVPENNGHTEAAEKPATVQQLNSIKNLQKLLGMEQTDLTGLGYDDCSALLKELSQRFNEQKKKAS